MNSCASQLSLLLICHLLSPKSDYSQHQPEIKCWRDSITTSTQAEKNKTNLLGVGGYYLTSSMGIQTNPIVIAILMCCRYS